MGQRVCGDLGRVDGGGGDDHVNRYTTDRPRAGDGWVAAYVVGALYLAMCVAYVVVGAR